MQGGTEEENPAGLPRSHVEINKHAQGGQNLMSPQQNEMAARAPSSFELSFFIEIRDRRHRFIKGAVN